VIESAVGVFSAVSTGVRIDCIPRDELSDLLQVASFRNLKLRIPPGAPVSVYISVLLT
jgi:hypothetical protein